MVDLGFVGEPEKVDLTLLNQLIGHELIPVLAPLATSKTGQTFNVNADTFAGAVAGALKAKRLLLLTDVPGVLDKSKKLIPELSVKDARKLIADGTISGGMIPKVETCIYALEQGVQGRRDHRRQDPACGVARTVHQPGHGHADPQVMTQAATPSRAVMKNMAGFIPAIALLAGAAPAHADLKLCNRMSYVVEAAIGIDDKAATADPRLVSHRSGGMPGGGAGHADRRPHPAQRARARRLWRLADPAERRRHAVRRARQFRHRGGAPMPRRANLRAVYPDHPRHRPTTAIWWLIWPKTANMTTNRPSSPASSGYW